jgi:hypothetical protein
MLELLNSGWFCYGLAVIIILSISRFFPDV